MVAQNERLKAKRKEYISNDVDLPLEFFQLPELGEVVPPEPETKVAESMPPEVEPSEPNLKVEQPSPPTTPAPPPAAKSRDLVSQLE